jgi:hypothetical protein
LLLFKGAVEASFDMTTLAFGISDNFLPTCNDRRQVNLQGVVKDKASYRLLQSSHYSLKAQKGIINESPDN